MLLYAKTDEQIIPDNEYHMSGNKISVKTLDLNLDFSDIHGIMYLKWTVQTGTKYGFKVIL